MEVGSIEYIATIDTSKYKRGANEIEKANRDMEGSTSGAERSTSRLSSALSKLGTVARYAAAASTALLAASTVAAAKASWDQVNAVQQATATLGRFYQNAGDVTKVQKELIAYAQSDMGVLFNRKDLFAAAGNLAMFGVEAGKVTDHVKILSRLAASGAVSWDELNSVIGRVVSSGKLGRAEWEMLNKAGAGLSDSLANTTVNADELFKTLDTNVAKDISQDMNNIVPVGIRLQSALRSVGNAILGVNELQDGFLPGSLGERIVKTMQWLTELGNNVAPNVRDIMTRVSEVVSKFAPTVQKVATSIAEYLMPKLTALWSTISNDVLPVLTRLWKEVLQPIIPVIGTALVIAIGGVIDITNGLLTVVGSLTKWLLDNKPIVVALAIAFGGLATAMAIQGAVSAFNAGMTVVRSAIATTQTNLVAFRALVASPIAMGAIGVAAALASIYMVYNAVQSVIGAIQQMNEVHKAEDRLTAEQARIRQKAMGMINSGDAAQAARGRKLLSDLSAINMYKGGQVSANQPYLVGENRDGSINDTTELFVPRTAGRIVNSKDLQEALSNTGGSSQTYQVNINVSGAIVTSPQDQRKFAEVIGKRLNEVMTQKGYKPSIQGV